MAITSCDMDGYTEDNRGREYYWHCEEPPVMFLNGMWLCEGHGNDVALDNRSQLKLF